ncbi:ABC transporter ATP-binding protein [Streptomyces thinghirensis]|uniref:ATP-binding cassette domain-containing protein n=1 Tax=Streptomyces thinghirensis TaxID=551547 RepID=A0ABP9T7J9_9ACTN
MSLLEVHRLGASFEAAGQTRTILREVSFAVDEGEALGLVGESGSGKSMTLRSIIGLLPTPVSTKGEIKFDGIALGDRTARSSRRRLAMNVAMVHQDPRAALNPLRTIGDSLCEGLVYGQDIKRSVAAQRAVQLLGDVGISQPARRMRQRPHELSGGMLQRVMIAAALIGEPRLLLADEPTTALDVTTQEEVMAILNEQRQDRGLALVFVTHDLDLAAAVCDRVAVMNAGAIVEDISAARLHERARHPYTRGLLTARPTKHTEPGSRLQVVPGRPSSAHEAGSGCTFASRCSSVMDQCRSERPSLRRDSAGSVACHRVAVDPQGPREEAGHA